MSLMGPSSANANSREQCVKDTLSGKQWVIRGVLLGNRTRSADGPSLHHGVLSRLALKFSLEYDVLNEFEYPCNPTLRHAVR